MDVDGSVSVDETDATASCNPLQLPSDGLARLLRALSSLEMVRCLSEVARQPRLIRAMFGSHMTPLAAYILTSKLESAEQERVFSDQQSNQQAGVGVIGASESEGLAQPSLQCEGSSSNNNSTAGMSQAEFYCRLYGACEDVDAVRAFCE